MSTAIERSSLPRLEDYPIPHDVQPDRSWSVEMLEMAAHIGPMATLHILDAYGGQKVYIPRDPDKNPFSKVLSREHVMKISWAYGTTTLQLPVARPALARARRRAVIAAVRIGALPTRDAAIILGTSRKYLGKLLDRKEERGGVPIPMPRRGAADVRQISIFDVLGDSIAP